MILRNVNQILYLIIFISINISAIDIRLLDEILLPYKDLNIGLKIYNLTKKETVYSKNEKKKFIPASITKLFTSLSALETLGPKYKFKTQILLDGYIENNIVYGDIYLKGNGDPSLTSADIKDLVKKIVTKYKINNILGSFYIDNTHFDQNFFPPGSTIDDIGSSWLNPVSSLIVDHKGTNSGFDLSCFLNRKEDKPIKLFFNIKKFINKLLAKENIKLNGTISFGQAKENFKILSIHKSSKLKNIILKMNKYSDNLYADCLFKKLGFLNFNKGTWSNGLKAIDYFIQESIKLDPTNIKIVDGSGLSRYNLVSPDQVVKLLEWASQKSYFPIFFKSLPVNGIDGTLKNRIIEIPNKINAKTGSLGGVSCLAGYIKINKNIFAFSIFINNFISKSNSIKTSDIKTKIEDAICKIIIQ